jgi:energy-coupling factor transporter ATP-binding protein EcfA2
MTSVQAPVKCYPRGSEWRKWDLHVHPPGTKLNDGYGTPSDLDRFCHVLEDSDVQVFAIADYFSVQAYYAVAERFYELFPQSNKVLLPNIELRLNETVNGSSHIVDLHLIFRPDVDQSRLERLLRELKTQITDERDVPLRCSELSTKAHFESATVSRVDIEEAIAQTFGKNSWRTDNVLIIVPSNNNGIRAGGSEQRKRNLADQIDKLCDAFYGNLNNVDYFLRTDRYEDSTQKSKPKPVFAGSDAHSFKELDDWLGRTVDGTGTRKYITWIKADPTFEGLQQTLFEPSSRVHIQASRPDTKEPYKVISAVHFQDPGFPSTVVLNPGLVSIIGSRSSGKSALLAYIAHAIDPTYTVAQQIASGIMGKDEAGPAAGKTWAEVSNIICTVEWADAEVHEGKVIYIPQNSLFSVSERPEEITAKIQPALFRMDAGLKTSHQRMQADVKASKAIIGEAVGQWFGIGDRMASIRAELRDLGDPQAIASTRDGIARQLTELRQSSKLTPEEVEAYQGIIEQLGGNSSRQATIVQETVNIAPYLSHINDEYQTVGISVAVTITPPPSVFPRELESQLGRIVSAAVASLNEAVRSAVTAYQSTINDEAARLLAEEEQLRSDNSGLIAKNQANVELEELVQGHNKQEELLKEIAGRKANLDRLAVLQLGQVQIIKAELVALQRHVEEFARHFNTTERTLDNVIFGVESQVNEETLQTLSASFNRQENTDYFDRSSELIKLDKVLSDPGAFLERLRDGAQKTRRGIVLTDIATQALTIIPEVRFIAILEGDRIGGFKRSSMTPGKQSLFALSLILNESAEAWPLLIDQPEDDLDSRSIFDTIVPYLAERKCDRQILMVSHDANLVVGADSEQLVVANRHGDDRRNRESRTFEYLTGSLEYSLPETKAEYILEKCGVREHACEILDGGAEAFQKRRDKYKI